MDGDLGPRWVEALASVINRWVARREVVRRKQEGRKVHDTAALPIVILQLFAARWNTSRGILRQIKNDCSRSARVSGALMEQQRRE